MWTIFVTFRSIVISFIATVSIYISSKIYFILSPHCKPTPNLCYSIPNMLTLFEARRQLFSLINRLFHVLQNLRNPGASCSLWLKGCSMCCRTCGIQAPAVLSDWQSVPCDAEPKEQRRQLFSPINRLFHVLQNLRNPGASCSLWFTGCSIWCKT